MWPRKSKKDLEAHKALFLAERHLEEVQSRRGEVDDIVAKSVGVRHQNHFAQHFIKLLEGGRAS